MSVMGMPPHVRRWANTKDAAAHIGCNAEVLRRWHREGSKPVAADSPSNAQLVVGLGRVEIRNRLKHPRNWVMIGP